MNKSMTREAKKNNGNLIIGKDGNSIFVNTDVFALDETIYLVNVKYYGNRTDQAKVKINLGVSGCKKIEVKFRSEVTGKKNDENSPV